MKEWYVISGPSSPSLASRIANRLDANIVEVEVKIFSDGESKLRINGNVRNKKVVLVQSIYPPVDRHLFQTICLAHRLSEDGAQVYAVIPYIGYSRQDKEFMKGEVITLGSIAHFFRSAGIQRLITVDIHSPHGLGYFSIPSYSVSAIPLLAEHIRKIKTDNNLIAISPDFGASARVEAFAKVLDIEHLILEKHRDRVTGEVTVLQRDIEVNGKTVIIVDDIISTGGTVQRAAILLKKYGAKRIYAICTHPILTNGALDKMRSSGVNEIIGTNSIPSPVSIVDISPILTSYLETL